ncbi:precorrin-6A synthase (deacetylating) [Roseobacter sinensis]|uniref:Precorrin-6A synthase [deacetylating] n=1 Tax=Roseobacter sinensis TaxID=2931391 RepID=A0ABT3BDA6_9RHOB|nr:precorrin-6A synthase (deacetylating) [Roseobacter sp. WL0113]MCV3271389.1 precorrin-6A synthase (deacetylating) [Roseobacter sp. WL0113]
MNELWLIGIGTGSPQHLTGEGLRAIREAGTILVPHKGPAKDDLAELRYQLIEAAGATGQVVRFDYPERDPALPYEERVSRWHDEIAARWVSAAEDARSAGPVALLVWGDPALYDSTLRIAGRLQPAPKVRVVPGITAVQALTAAHAIPLNDVNGPIQITTGRRLRDEGWPDGIDRLVVMLDGEASFRTLAGSDLTIWWGAYLGMPEEILQFGPLDQIAPVILEAREAARARHGWIMDTYLLARSPR